jgi:probable F420-dependent oxidoreductase
MAAFVRAADEAGVHRIWLGDHVAWPATHDSTYPFTVGRDDKRFGAGDGKAGFLESGNRRFLEGLTTAGFVLGASPRLGVGLCVLILPMRNVVLTAKELATLDVLGGGRLVAGIGAGWLREEFEVLGAPFERRYARMEEGIAALRALWGPQPSSFAGDLVSVPPVYCEPTPNTQGGVPIYIGGHSEPALARTARLADGLILTEMPPDAVADARRRLAGYLREAGRPEDAVEIVVLLRLRLGDGADRAEAAGIVAAYRAAGCDELVLYASPSRTAAANADRVLAFGELAADLDLLAS